MSSIITQEVHIIKEVFGEAVVDAIINSIEEAIKDAPKSINSNTNIPNALYMFADLFYDENGLCRLESFEQYGPIYVAKIYDKTAGEKNEIYLAYSLFDIIETFNSISEKNLCRVPYIRITSTHLGAELRVASVDSPKSYEDHCEICDYEKALNEIGKYKFSFKDGEVYTVFDVICNSHMISASNAFETINKIELADNICGEIILEKTGHVIDAEIDYISEAVVVDANISKEFCKDNDEIYSADSMFTAEEQNIFEKVVSATDENNEEIGVVFKGWIRQDDEDPILDFKELSSYILEPGINRFYPVYVRLPKVPEQIVISHNDEIEVGKTIQLNSNIEGVEWSSSDDSIATISDDGLVTGVSAGTAIITASKEGCVTGTISITVKAVDVPLEVIEITGSNAVEVGSTITLTANTEDVSWSSSNDSIATVDENGVVTGVAEGTVTVFAIKSGFASANKSITVFASAISEFTSKFVDDIHAGTGNYGYSIDAEPVDQTLNQDKIVITTYKKGDESIIALTGDPNQLESWTSTDPSQQDEPYKWYALDFVFKADELESGIIWGTNIEITPDILDADEGERTLTLWLKLDELIDGATKTVRLTDKNDPENTESIVIRFTPAITEGE